MVVQGIKSSILSSREKSKYVYDASCQVFPGGVNSPVRAFKEIGLTPLVVESAEGDQLIDVDGNRYIDFCMSWGSLILGHAHPKIVEAVCQRVRRGSSYGTITPIEKELASAILAKMPWLEKLRFVSSGTEATMTAIRLARGYTGKKKIIKFIGNYHGHHDQLLVQAGSGLSLLNPQSSSKGVPEETILHTLSLPYNDVACLTSVFETEKDIAAVIFEPVAGNMGVVPSNPIFIKALRELTQQYGALLIADEVISGFRIGPGGASRYYGLEADLTCLGKIIGGGFPVAAFGGKSLYMDLLAPLGEVYQAGTLSGNPVAMAAGLATLEMLRQNFYEELQAKTDRLTKAVKEEIERRELPCSLNQVGSMFTLFFGPRKVESKKDLADLQPEWFRTYFRLLFEEGGIYMAPSQYEACFVSAAHTDEHLDYTKEIILNFLKNLF